MARSLEAPTIQVIRIEWGICLDQALGWPFEQWSIRVYTCPTMIGMIDGAEIVGSLNADTWYVEIKTFLKSVAERRLWLCTREKRQRLAAHLRGCGKRSLKNMIIGPERCRYRFHADLAICITDLEGWPKRAMAACWARSLAMDNNQSWIIYIAVTGNI